MAAGDFGSRLRTQSAAEFGVGGEFSNSRRSRVDILKWHDPAALLTDEIRHAAGALEADDGQSGVCSFQCHKRKWILARREQEDITGGQATSGIGPLAQEPDAVTHTAPGNQFIQGTALFVGTGADPEKTQMRQRSARLGRNFNEQIGALSPIGGTATKHGNVLVIELQVLPAGLGNGGGLGFRRGIDKCIDNRHSIRRNTMAGFEIFGDWFGHGHEVGGAP
jgi:hypothetical protein